MQFDRLDACGNVAVGLHMDANWLQRKRIRIAVAQSVCVQTYADGSISTDADISAL